MLGIVCPVQERREPPVGLHGPKGQGCGFSTDYSVSLPSLYTGTCFGHSTAWKEDRPFLCKLGASTCGTGSLRSGWAWKGTLWE